MTRPTLGFALVFVLIRPACGGDEYAAKVVGISDGDTLTVLRGKEQVKLRLHGIDAPETGQDFGTKAKGHASSLAFGKEVTVRPVEKDRYGRTVAKVELPDGTSLNERMLAEGFAWWYAKYAPHDDALKHAEQAARDARRGLWAAAKAIAPWDWRAGKGLPPGDAAKVIANRNSRLYHMATCRNAAKIAERNRVAFETAEDAVGAGYRAAKDCHQSSDRGSTSPSR